MGIWMYGYIKIENSMDIESRDKDKVNRDRNKEI